MCCALYHCRNFSYHCWLVIAASSLVTSSRRLTKAQTSATCFWTAFSRRRWRNARWVDNSRFRMCRCWVHLYLHPLKISAVPREPWGGLTGVWSPFTVIKRLCFYLVGDSSSPNCLFDMLNMRAPTQVPRGSPSCSRDVTVYVWHTSRACPLLFILFLCLSVFVTLSTVFYSISSPNNTVLSLCSSGFISALLVLSTIYLFMKVSFSPDVIPSVWLDSKHQWTI